MEFGRPIPKTCRSSSIHCARRSTAQNRRPSRVEIRWNDVLRRKGLISVEVGQRRFPNGTQHGGSRSFDNVHGLLDSMLGGRQGVLLVRQYRPSVDSELWELPDGSLNHGEEAEGSRSERMRRRERLRSKHRSCGWRLSTRHPGLRRGADLLPGTGLEPAGHRHSPYHPDEDEDIVTQTFYPRGRSGIWWDQAKSSICKDADPASRSVSESPRGR